MTEPLGTERLLEVQALTKTYDDGRIEALRGVDLTIHSGEFVTISGPSGSGKSTLLHMLGGLDSPTTGQVLFQGLAMGSAISLDDYRARHIGFIFQAFHLMPTLRAVENVQVPMLAIDGKQGSYARKNQIQRSEELLTELGLEHRMRQYPNELSAGERQRVAIARALANDPEILLADEPTGNLDSANTARILEILTGIQQKRGMTLIIVTHEPEIAESAPRHVRFRDGRIEAET